MRKEQIEFKLKQCQIAQSCTKICLDFNSYLCETYLAKKSKVANTIISEP